MHSKQKSKIVIIILLGIFIPILSLLCLYHFFIQPIYNPKLQAFVKNFENIDLPENTEQIGETYYYFGKGHANGNHCDYYAEKLIKTELTEAELTEYYGNKEIAAANPNGIMIVGKKRGNDPVSIYVFPITRSEELTEEEKIKYSQDFQLDPTEVTEKLFTVYALDDDYEGRYLVCH